MQISLVIPNFNGRHLLAKNLPHVIKAFSVAEIIVVDDDPLIRRMLVGHLQKQEITVLGVANCQQAQEE